MKNQAPGANVMGLLQRTYEHVNTMLPFCLRVVRLAEFSFRSLDDLVMEGRVQLPKIHAEAIRPPMDIKPCRVPGVQATFFQYSSRAYLLYILPTVTHPHPELFR